MELGQLTGCWKQLYTIIEELKDKYIFISIRRRNVISTKAEDMGSYHRQHATKDQRIAYFVSWQGDGAYWRWQPL